MRLWKKLVCWSGNRRLFILLPNSYSHYVAYLRRRYSFDSLQWIQEQEAKDSPLHAFASASEI